MAEVQQFGEASNVNEVFCKCSDGWTCEITKTDRPNSGKSFLKCRDGRTCEITDFGKCGIAEGPTAGEVDCKCPEGWSCVITKTAA